MEHVAKSKKRSLTSSEEEGRDECGPDDRRHRTVVSRLSRAIEAGATVQHLLLSAVKHDSPDACALLLLLLGFETEFSSTETAQDLFCRLPHCVAAAQACDEIRAAVSHALSVLPYAAMPQNCLGQFRYYFPREHPEGFGIISTAAAALLINTVVLVPSSRPCFALPAVFSTPGIIFDVILRDQTPEQLWATALIHGASPATLTEAAFNVCAWYGYLPEAFSDIRRFFDSSRFRALFTESTFVGIGWQEVRDWKNGRPSSVFKYDCLAVNTILWRDWGAKLDIVVEEAAADASAALPLPTAVAVRGLDGRYEKFWSEIIIDDGCRFKTQANGTITATTDLLDFIVHAEVEVYRAYSRDRDANLKRLLTSTEKYGAPYLSCLLRHFPAVLDAVLFDARTFGYYLLKNVVNRVNLLRPVHQTDLLLLRFLQAKGYVARHAGDYSTTETRATFSPSGIYSYDAFYATMTTTSLLL